MHRYFFILGRNPALSIAELLSVIKLNINDCKIESFSREVCLIVTPEKLDILLLVKQLGGMVKAGEMLDEVNLDASEADFDNIISYSNLTEKYIPRQLKKIHYGISIYPLGCEEKLLESFEQKLKVLYISIKDNLREKGIKAGFVRLKERNLSSVSVAKNNLLDKGMELIFLLDKNRLLAGKTLAVQEFGGFTFRDIGRPGIDKRSGIMPPKLARMMINIAGVADKSKLLLDPFCGSGTILQEGLILGYKNIIGSDVSGKAVGDTKRNISWLFDRYRNLEKDEYRINIFQSDVRNILKTTPGGSVDFITTEPFLGPPLHGKPKRIQSERMIRELEPLYLSAFGQFYKLLKPGCPVVFIFPVFEEKGIFSFVNIIGKIEKMGFRQVAFDQPDRNTVFQEITKRNTIIYGNRYDFVMREIIKFQRI